MLTLKGINYKANVFINNNIVATKSDIVGTFRSFQLDITQVCHLVSNIRVYFFVNLFVFLLVS